MLVSLPPTFYFSVFLSDSFLHSILKLSAYSLLQKMSISYKTLESIFSHVVLPPRLPGKQDDWIEEVDRELLSRLQEAVKTVKSFSEEEDNSVWDAILKSLQACGLVENDRYINKTALLQALDNLEPCQSIILRIQEQNAGLLIRHIG